MDQDRCHQLAERLHPLLVQAVGMGLDTQRMLTEPLYARDVLLVCAAHPGTELAELAGEYRAAAAPPRPPRTSAAAVAAEPSRRQSHGGRKTPAEAAKAAQLVKVSEVAEGVKAAKAPHTAPAAVPAKAEDAADSESATDGPRSPLSRFSRLSLSRFGASIFGGSLFEGTLFGGQKADPVTDFGDDSYLAPPPARDKRRPAKAAAPASPRRTRWFGR